VLASSGSIAKIWSAVLFRVGGPVDADRRDVLLTEYTEVSQNFRMLTDIRFKLLAFLPIASGAAAAVISRRGGGVDALGLALFGLVVTAGLVTYNGRNDQLYDTLVGRAAAIERSLGVPDGAFANRPRDWFRLDVWREIGWEIDHRTAVATIYYASIALWLYAAFSASGELAARHHEGSWWWIDLICLALAVVVTGVGSRVVKNRKKQAAKRLRTLAAIAVTLATDREVADVVRSEAFLCACQLLAGEDRTTVTARASFFAALDKRSLPYYLGRETGEVTAARLVGAITDLAPEWLFDCATSRRRLISY
jgi:hypothetical protein